MNVNPYDLIATELCRLHQAEGAELWRNRIRLTGLLLDHQPELRREIRSVVSGVEQGVAAALTDTERSLSGIAIDRQASLLETESGLRSEIALNVTRTIAHALNLGPLPSVYGHSAPRAAAAPPVNLERHQPSQPQPLHMPPHHPLPTPAPQQHWSDPRDQRPYPGHSTGRRSFPWAVVIIGSAVLIGGGVLTATLLPRGGGNTAGSSATSTSTPATPPGDVALQVGQWEYVFTATAVEAPGAPPAVLQQAQSQIGTPQRRTQCVTTNDTSNLAQQISTQLSASLGQQASCTLSRETFAQGRIDIAGTCQAPTGSLDMAIIGSYTAATSQTAITMNVTNNGQLVTVQGTESGRRIGECGS